jgi:hypothetical protein
MTLRQLATGATSLEIGLMFNDGEARQLDISFGCYH